MGSIIDKLREQLEKDLKCYECVNKDTTCFTCFKTDEKSLEIIKKYTIKIIKLSKIV